MKARKLVSFLLLKPAFSARNLTSILFVGLFFGVYVMAGGKVTAVPKGIKPGASFGSVSAVQNLQTNTPATPRANDSRAEGRPSTKLNTPLFGNSTTGGENNLAPSRESTPSSADDTNALSDIEERLKRIPRRTN